MLRRPLESAQYASADYRTALHSAGMQASMSRRADCYDNAPMESFFHTLKTEQVHHQQYATRDQAKCDIFAYIEGFYNRASEHPSGYVIDEKRFCWLGCDPAGSFRFSRARSVMD